MFEQIRDWVQENRPDAWAFGSALVGYLLVITGLYLLIGELGVLLVGIGILLLSGMGLWTVGSFMWDGVYTSYLDYRGQER